MVVRKPLTLICLLCAPVYGYAVDLYGSSPSAQSASLGGLFSGSGSGPTDILAANPAALTSLTRPTFEFSTLGIFARGDYRNSTGIPGSLQNSAGLAGSAAFGSRLASSRVSIGLGFLPVSMLSDRWRFVDPVGGAGASYGLQTNKSAFVALQSTLGVAVQVTKQLSLGTTFGILYNANTLHAPYIFQNNPLAGLKTLLDLHTTGVGYNGSLGAVYSPSRLLEFGISYKTPTFVKSTGNATGSAATQFAVLGIAFQPTWSYRARVDNVFPQSSAAYIRWQAAHRLRLHLQADLVDWRNAFVALPVRLTQGTNAGINGLLGSSSLNDSIPLHWRNQLTWRTGFTYSLTENVSLSGGYSHANNPVPAATLTPLTANIMQDALSTGASLNRGRYKFALAYQVNLPATSAVTKSDLLSGEFDNTRTRLWLQSVVLTTGIRF